MPDDIKSPSSPPPEGEPKPAADQPASPGGVKATPSGSSEAVPVSSETKPAPATPPKPAAAAPAAPATKPAAAPPKPAAPVPTVWDSPLIAKLKQKYGSGVEALTHLGQNYMVVDRSTIPEILQILRNEEEFDYCVDL